MVTIAVDDSITLAQQIRESMYSIDPGGSHYAIGTAEEALRTVSELKPDVVWLEIEMPGMNGLEIAAEIKGISPESNIVFVTGHPEYAVDAFAMHVSGFMLKPVTEERLRDEIDNLRRPVAKEDNSLLKVQCFGNFEVFGKNGIVKFTRSLGKEAFAYLVDRRGAGCTVGEICSVLWEDRQTDKNLKSQCRVIMASLKKDLTEIGAGEVLVKNWNIWGVDTSRVKCDYYDFLKLKNEPVNSFRGEYMAQYSWAEMTAGRLFDITGE